MSSASPQEAAVRARDDTPAAGAGPVRGTGRKPRPPIHIPDRIPKWMPRWIRKRIEINLWHQREMLEEAKRRTPPTARVLDAGAGEGRFRPYFEHARYTDIDVAVGEQSWDYSGLDTLGSLDRLPYADNTFDVVLCTMVLEHVMEPQLVLNEIARVLRPGGSLYVSVPQQMWQHQKPYDFFRYTSYGLRYLLDKAGLDIAFIKPMGGYFWQLSFEIQSLAYWVLPRPRRRWLNALRYPALVVVQGICIVALPLLLYYLDRLDRFKDCTIGWVLEARKRMST